MGEARRENGHRDHLLDWGCAGGLAACGEAAHRFAAGVCWHDGGGDGDEVVRNGMLIAWLGLAWLGSGRVCGRWLMRRQLRVLGGLFKASWKGAAPTES